MPLREHENVPAVRVLLRCRKLVADMLRDAGEVAVPIDATQCDATQHTPACVEPSITITITHIPARTADFISARPHPIPVRADAQRVVMCIAVEQDLVDLRSVNGRPR